MSSSTEGEEVDSDNMLYIFLGYGVALMGGLTAVLYYFFVYKNKKVVEKKRGEDTEIDETLATNSVGLEDVTYIASKLRPDSDQLDILLAVCSTPESINWSTKALANREKIVQARLEDDKKKAEDEKSAPKKASGELFNLDDDGWANEDEDDEDLDDEEKEKAKKAKETLEEKQKFGEELAKASGKVTIYLEGVDEGVVGQEWVEKALKKVGAWPLDDLRFLKDMTFEYKGKQVSAMDHPGLRRNLCFVAGRLNSLALNSHPELLDAASKQLIDPTYFKNAADFRQRCAMLLEASLRAAVGLRSYPLTKTIVEAVSIFKIGCTSCTPKDVEWFNAIMMKQYRVLPRLLIENTSIENAKHPEMATSDVLLISLDLTRLHAENFTRQKVAMLQKQGIPPQMALQQYREGWWYFVCAERLDGETPASAVEIKKEGILNQVEDADLKKFEKTKFEDRLLTAWPMIVANVAQKSGKVKIQFKAPSVPGKYKFNVAVKSQDFLGADQVFSVEADIVDSALLGDSRKAATAEIEGDDKADKDEGKKDN